MQQLLYTFAILCIPVGAISLVNAYQYFKDYIDNKELWRQYKGAFYFFLIAGLLLWTSFLVTIKYAL